MTDLLLIGLALLGQWCLGVAIAVVILGKLLFAVRTPGVLSSRAELVGLGLVLGIGANSYLQFAWSLAGGRLGRGCSLALVIGGIGLGLAAWLLGRRRWPAGEGASIPEVPPQTRSFVRCCAATIAGLWLFALVQTLLTPQKFWDERAYYGLRAIVLYEDRTVHSPDLAEPDFVQGHPRYPLLISLAEQHLYAMLGRVDDRLSKVLFPMLYLGMVLTTAGVLMRHLEIGPAWLGAVLLATVPVLMPDDYGFLCGQADAPVACLEGVALLYLWDSLVSLQRMPGDRSAWVRSLIAGTLCCSLAAFTKDEGIAHGFVHSIAFLMAVTVWGCGNTRRERPLGGHWARRTGIVAAMSAAVLAVVPALILSPWFVHRRHLPLTGEMNYFSRLTVESVWKGLPTLAWSVPHLAARMFSEAFTWGLQWWFLAATLILFPRRAIRAPQLFLLITLLGDLAALLLAGMIAPVTLQEHIGGSSHRFLMQLAPAAVLFGVGQLSLPLSRDVAGADRAP